jgi:RNA polymerase sigma-70 factor (ECF subfamily)
VATPDLLQRFSSGDPDAFMSIYQAHTADLRPLVARFFASPFEREEALQEIWMHVHKVARSYDPARGELRPWLRVIASNRCREILRARGRRPVLAAALDEESDGHAAATADTPESTAQRDRLQAVVTQFVQQLDAEEAAVFRLALLEERTHDEVAAAVGISPRRAKYLKLKLLERAAASPALRAVLAEVCDP